MKFYMFQAVCLSIIGSLFTVYSAMVYVIQVYRQLLSRAILALLESCLHICVPSWLCLEAVIKNLHDTYRCRMYSRELLMMGKRSYLKHVEF